MSALNVYDNNCNMLNTISISAPASASHQPDERTLFNHWIATRTAEIPQDSWDDYQFAGMRLMQDYTRPWPNPNTSSISTTQPSPMQPVQKLWSHYLNQHLGKMQISQQQWPQQQQWDSHRYKCCSPASPTSHRTSCTHPTLQSLQR